MTDPIASYSPELLSALVEGSRRDLTLHMTYREAVILRQRINSLRSAMKKESHPLASIVAKTSVRIEFKPDTMLRSGRKGPRTPLNTDTPVTLIIAPRDAVFRPMLEAAGVTIKPIEDFNIDPSAPDPDPVPAPSPIESILNKSDDDDKS